MISSRLGGSRPVTLASILALKRTDSLATPAVWPLTNDEVDGQIFCIFMMCSAACLFGLILGELQEIFATTYARRREEDEHIESVISFLRENRFRLRLF
jgi:hypothetical protein